MEYGGVLVRPKEDRFCYCISCKILWQDEIVNYGSICCPTIGCTNAVHRGLTRSKAKDLVDESHKELLS